ncbi:MAG TPA: hypothetical protein VFA04_10895 [Bryobacteraceae bacterium]|nr:hypothetical protein [Bryobacteraceae bacterium]
MSRALKFDVVCPNNHNQTIRYTEEEFEKAVKSGTLVLHCNTCDTSWNLSHQEIAKMRKEFAKEG